MLFLYWRWDSIRYVLKHKKWNEAARLVAHWSIFAALMPIKTLMLGKIWVRLGEKW